MSCGPIKGPAVFASVVWGPAATVTIVVVISGWCPGVAGPAAGGARDRGEVQRLLPTDAPGPATAIFDWVD